jgi:hypothetical protein
MAARPPAGATGAAGAAVCAGVGAAADVPPGGTRCTACTAHPVRRKEYFIETGQRHYYFMNVGNGEVIDASRRVRTAALHQACTCVLQRCM